MVLNGGKVPDRHIIYYYWSIREKYEELDLKNKPSIASIFGKAPPTPNAKLDKLRISLLKAQAQIRVFEIESFNEAQETLKLKFGKF